VAVALCAGVIVLATGCVHERVTVVKRAYPNEVQAPVLAAPPPVVTSAPEMVDLLPVAPPAPMVPIRSAADLDRMLAPIALYPDPLLAQILPAATLPEQVVLVDRYLREGGDVNQVDAQPWDSSLKALARYPATLRMLDDNLAWTTDLGQAFLNQPADVMDSVQRLRARAWALGNLQSTPQQTVVVSGGIIEIVPTAPQIIYVPVYQPGLVYVQPPPGPGRFYISFGVGFSVGQWLNHDCDWHHHEVIVWHHDHPRPADWWYRPPDRREAPTVVNNVTVVNNTTVVNQGFTVWRPQARGAAIDRGDRGWSQPDIRNPVATARNEGPKSPQAPVLAETQKPVAPKEVRTTVPVREPPPTQPAVRPPPARPPEARVTSPPEEAKPAPVISAPREAPPIPPRRNVQAAPAAPRQPITVKPAVAPARVAAQTSNGRQLLAREVTPVQRPNPPVPAPKDPRPAVAPPKQAPAPSGTARPAAPSATSRPVANARVRAPSSALTGIESSQATRQASERGQQSREIITKPVTPPRPAAAKAGSPKANAVEAKRPPQSRAK